MIKDFKGKTAFVTGGGSGIGFAMARAFGRAGMNVVVADIDLGAAKGAVERLANEHTAQCLDYLRATGRTVCLLVNFQRSKVEWRRIVSGFQIPDK